MPPPPHGGITTPERTTPCAHHYQPAHTATSKPPKKPNGKWEAHTIYRDHNGRKYRVTTQATTRPAATLKLKNKLHTYQPATSKITPTTTVTEGTQAYRHGTINRINQQYGGLTLQEITPPPSKTSSNTSPKNAPTPTVKTGAAHTPPRTLSSYSV